MDRDNDFDKGYDTAVMDFLISLVSMLSYEEAVYFLNKAKEYKWEIEKSKKK